MDGSINLLVFETWLDDQIKVCFNPLADIVNKQDLANKGTISLHYIRSTLSWSVVTKCRTCLTLSHSQDIDLA